MNNRILVAPLNWGLGHATRCVPIINALLQENFIPIIASDGTSLEFLRQEFPNLETLELPSYHISYAKNLKWNLLLKMPKILKAIQLERKIIKRFIDENNTVIGLISDNRFGVRSDKVVSVYMTHQVNVFSGITTFLTSKIHQKIIKKYDECWIPDQDNSSLSGKLSRTKTDLNQKYIGVLSRFKKQQLEENIPVLILISGPEPNRTYFEEKLISEFKNDSRKIVFVLGKVESKQKKWQQKNLTFYNYLLSHELQEIVNVSKIVICSAGYSSIMDLAVLQKKVFFIPTENQNEQVYLARFLKENKIAPFCKLKDFTSERVLEMKSFKGFNSVETKLDPNLFGLFERK
jgi:UDP-N-acetylglucosamine:LPS N-acetylglucosamine transferase